MSKKLSNSQASITPMSAKMLARFMSVALPTKQALLLIGDAGKGKSSLVRQVAESMGARLIDRRLSECEPSDLVGLPYLATEGKQKVTKFARPSWWPTDEDEKVILFLDELDRAKEDMQPVAMQLTLDRRAGDTVLPDNVMIVAAMNGERYQTAAVDQALMSRFAVVEFQPEVSEWIVHAVNTGHHQTVVDFIRSNPSQLDTPDKDIGAANTVTTSRRSWSHLSNALNLWQQREPRTNIAQSDDLMSIAAAYIGMGAAHTFQMWVKEKFVTLSPDDIYTGKANAKKVSAQQAAALIEEIVETFKSRTDEERGTALKFYMESGVEIFSALFAALPPTAAALLHKHKEVETFISTMGHRFTEELSKQDEKKSAVAAPEET
jgi:MoxR-like ATPase